MNNSQKPARRRSEKRKRTHGVFVRLTEEEFAHAREQATVTGLGTAKLMRELLKGVKIKPAKKLPDDVYHTVMSFGNDLNQLAKAMNAYPCDCTDRLVELKQEVGALVTCLRQS
jgi:hypothetical protein